LVENLKETIGKQKEMLDEAKNALQTEKMDNQFRLMNENINNLANENIEKLTATFRQQMSKTTQAVE
jgi:hypothetical protein